MTDVGEEETSKESKAFQLLMEKISLSISNPESTAFSLYSAEIISKAKRDEISDYEQTSKKKRVLLRAVEDQIALTPETYHKFCGILSRDSSNEFICQKMREQCPREGSGNQKIGSSASTGAAAYPVTRSVQQPSSQSLEGFTASAKSADRPSSSAKLSTHPASPVKGDIPAGTDSERILGGDDLHQILDEIRDVTGVMSLGVNLGLNFSAIEKIQIDHKAVDEQKAHILHAWLQRQDIVPNMQSHLPTWSELADALAKDNYALSMKIRHKYCKTSS